MNIENADIIGGWCSMSLQNFGQNFPPVLDVFLARMESCGILTLNYVMVIKGGLDLKTPWERRIRLQR